MCTTCVYTGLLEQIKQSVLQRGKCNSDDSNANIPPISSNDKMIIICEVDLLTHTWGTCKGMGRLYVVFIWNRNMYTGYYFDRYCKDSENSLHQMNGESGFTSAIFHQHYYKIMHNRRAVMDFSERKRIKIKNSRSWNEAQRVIA